MARSRDISKVLSSNTTLSNSYLTLSSASTTYAPVAGGSLVQIVPTTIANTGGTASISSIGTVSFSGTSSISLNNIFSSTYLNYRIVLNSTISGAGHMGIRLRSSGSDNSTSKYYSGYFYNNWSNNSTGVDDSGLTTSWTRMGYTNYSGGFVNICYDIFEPQTTTRTTINALQSRSDAVGVFLGGDYDDVQQFDGITFIPSTGTTTGTVTVFGYKK
jgi:hypothetical protein